VLKLCKPARRPCRVRNPTVTVGTPRRTFWCEAGVSSHDDDDDDDDGDEHAKK
jgi:hypothetical protein